MKWGKNTDGEPMGEANLNTFAESALNQVDARNYGDSLPPGPTLKWGIAFSGKKVAAVCE